MITILTPFRSALIFIRRQLPEPVIFHRIYVMSRHFVFSRMSKQEFVSHGGFLRKLATGEHIEESDARCFSLRHSTAGLLSPYADASAAASIVEEPRRRSSPTASVLA